MTTLVLLEVTDRVATVTLNRPQARNAMSVALCRDLRSQMAAAEADSEVDVVILTGADPAFCAGLDLKEIGASGSGGGASPLSEGGDGSRLPWDLLSKPVIGAINGVAITGGFEVALLCDFRLASEQARFGDTHARVGIMPGWGLSVLLPQYIGYARALEMSLTGNFMEADEALARGLVNHVVPHDELLPTVRKLAADIVNNDSAGVRTLLASYRAIRGMTGTDGLRHEQKVSAAWKERGFDPAEVEARRRAVQERGRSQV